MAPTKAELAKLPFAARLLLLLIAVAACAAPVYLLLPPDLLQAELQLWFDPSTHNLADPALQQSHRLLVALAAGVAGAVLLAVLLSLLRWSRRRRQWRQLPAPIRDLRRAMHRRDEVRVARAAGEAADHLGDEAVPHLLTALEAGYGDETRQAVAGALFRLGRALTAEVELFPGR